MNKATAALRHLVERSQTALSGTVLVLGAQFDDWVSLDWLFADAKPIWGTSMRSDALFCTRTDIAFERDVTHVAEGSAFDGAVVFASQSKQQCLGHLAIAAANVKPDGFVFFVGSKDLGVASLLKRASAVFETEQKVSKAHAVAAVMTLKAHSDEAIADWMHNASMQTWDDNTFETGIWNTAPGMFCHGRVDAGSALLAQHMTSCKGRVADFGAGWGFLARRLVSMPGVEAIDLYEADWAALEAAKLSLGAVHVDEMNPVSFHWHDIVIEPIDRIYDHIVMNPPFHTGKTTKASLGQIFIEKAARALRPGGSLTMVANTHLPYEAFMSRYFSKHQQIAQQDGFKVIRGVK